MIETASISHPIYERPVRSSQASSFLVLCHGQRIQRQASKKGPLIKDRLRPHSSRIVCLFASLGGINHSTLKHSIRHRSWWNLSKSLTTHRPLSIMDAPISSPSTHQVSSMASSQQSPSNAIVPPRPAQIKTPSTDAFLKDFTLVAEAAKRAQMACLMRDLENVGLS